MIDLPYTFDVLQDKKVILSEYDNHIIRHLSAMKGQFLDQDNYEDVLSVEDIILYEVY